MTILSQIIKNKTLIRIEKDYVDFIRTLLDPCNFKFSIRNYSSMFESLSKLFQEYCRQVIIDSLRNIDLKYRNSDLRKRDYRIETLSCDDFDSDNDTPLLDVRA